MTQYKEVFNALTKLPPDALALLGPIRTEAQYDQALEALDDLQHTVSGDLEHPLAGIYAALIERIAAYEDSAYPTLPTLPHVMLAHLLEAKGMTQSELAQHLRINQSNVSRLLSGQVSFTSELMKQLGEIFKVSAAVFVV